jgi:predicted nucleotidyltransferase
MAISEIISKCRMTLENHYGKMFGGVILYGSLACNQADMMSDIDLLVLLNRPFDYISELYRIIDVLYPIQLESDQLISAKPALSDEFGLGKIQLYRNVKEEGIPL